MSNKAAPLLPRNTAAMTKRVATDAEMPHLAAADPEAAGQATATTSTAANPVAAGLTTATTSAVADPKAATTSEAMSHTAMGRGVPMTSAAMGPAAAMEPEAPEAGPKKQRRRLAKLLHEMWAHRISYLFITPFLLCFIAFIAVPVLAAVALSFTYFNAIESPRFIGWQNFQYLISQDLLFLKHALPNTIKFALIVGPGGYVAAFLLAWLIVQLPARLRKWFALAMYTPSLTIGIAMSIVWLPMLSGDRIGYLNSILLRIGFIDVPKLWVTDPSLLMNAMIVVTLWSSMGVGFLAMLAGLLNVPQDYYEAARIDGLKSRLQEIWYITIPSMKPQMLFGAVMAIVTTFKTGAIGVELSGQNPTPEYAGHLIINHIDDFGFIRFEMGYAAAISVFLLLLMYVSNKLSWGLFGSKEDE